MSENPILKRMAEQKVANFRKPMGTVSRVNEQLGRGGDASGGTVNRLSVPSSDLPDEVQAGCSTIAPGGYRKKVALKPGRSSMDWSGLTMTKGREGLLITGIEKHTSNQDDDLFKINHPRSLEQVSKQVPLFMINPPLRITKEMVELHNTTDDCWCIIKDRVYCITNYFEFHPGGDKILKNYCSGIDATEQFYKYHKWVNAHKVLRTCYVGDLSK